MCDIKIVVLLLCDIKIVVLLLCDIKIVVLLLCDIKINNDPYFNLYLYYIILSF